MTTVFWGLMFAKWVQGAGFENDTLSFLCKLQEHTFAKMVHNSKGVMPIESEGARAPLRFLSQVDLNAASKRQKNRQLYFLYLIQSHRVIRDVQCVISSAAKFKSAFAGWR